VLGLLDEGERRAAVAGLELLARAAVLTRQPGRQGS
jgi:hypothetical protein